MSKIPDIAYISTDWMTGEKSEEKQEVQDYLKFLLSPDRWEVNGEKAKRVLDIELIRLRLSLSSILELLIKKGIVDFDEVVEALPSREDCLFKLNGKYPNEIS